MGFNNLLLSVNLESGEIATICFAGFTVLFAICISIIGLIFKRKEKLNKPIKITKINSFIRDYWFESAYLAISFGAIITTAVFFNSNILVPICTLLGIMGSVLNSKGNAFCYLLAMSSSIIYGIVSIRANFIGEVILHYAFIVPLCIFSLIKWLKPRKDSSTPKASPMYTLSKEKLVMYIVIGIIITGVYGVILDVIGSDLPYLNALSTVVLLFANLLGSKRVLEQWYFYLGSNVVLVVLWLLGGDKGNYPILIQNILYVIINVRGTVLWIKASGRLHEKPIEPDDER